LSNGASASSQVFVIAVRTLKAEGASNVADEVKVLLALKKQIEELQSNSNHHGHDQVVTPWDVQGAEEDGVQKV
jgi:orotidine-5'-phosphate decarboxylase